MFGVPYPSGALSDVEGTNDFHGVYGDTVGPAFTGSGSIEIDGVACFGGGSLPAFKAGYSYCEVRFAGISRTGTIGIADTSGAWDTVLYPSAARRGDLAVLCIGWETSVSADPQIESGWTLVGSVPGPGNTPVMAVWAQIITQDPDSRDFPILINGGVREGGGYIMTVYRRAVIDLANVATGSGTSVTTIPLPNVQIDVSGNIAATFIVTTGTPTSIGPTSVTSPQEDINSGGGDSGSGQASILALDEIKAATGSQPQAAITPLTGGGLSVDYVTLTVPLTQIGMWIYADESNGIGPAFRGSGSIQLTRHVNGGGVLPAFTSAGNIVVNISGREVGVESGSANSYTIAGSANSVVIAASANSVQTTPIDKNRLT